MFEQIKSCQPNAQAHIWPYWTALLLSLEKKQKSFISGIVTDLLLTIVNLAAWWCIFLKQNGLSHACYYTILWEKFV